MLAVQAICSCVNGTSMPRASSRAPEPAIASVKREPENLSLISFTSLLTAAPYIREVAAVSAENYPVVFVEDDDLRRSRTYVKPSV